MIFSKSGVILAEEKQVRSLWSSANHQSPSPLTDTTVPPIAVPDMRHTELHSHPVITSLDHLQFLCQVIRATKNGEEIITIFSF